MKSSRLLTRAITVLRCFNPTCPELTVSEMSHQVKIPKTTTQRILADLCDGGLLERKKENGKYTVGAELYFLGSLYLSTTDLIKAVEPIIQLLNNLTEEAVTVRILNGGYTTLVTRKYSKYRFQWSMNLGSIQPAHAHAAGKALLSELTEDEIDSIFPDEYLLQLTPKTIATRTELKAQLKEIKEKGISLTSEELFMGIHGIASLVRDFSGKSVAAINIGVPVFRINETRRDILAGLIKLGCSLASYRLGYRDYTNPVRCIEEIETWWKQKEQSLIH